MPDFRNIGEIRRQVAETKKNTIQYCLNLPHGIDWDTPENLENIERKDFWKQEGWTVRTDYWKSRDGHWCVAFFKKGMLYKSKNKPDDMKPMLIHDDIPIDFYSSFHHVYNLFDEIYKQEKPNTLHLLGCLLIYNAYLLHHKIIDNRPQYSPPAAAVRRLAGEYPYYNDAQGNRLKILAYLHYIDALAQNEDVVYRSHTRPGAGRENCLLSLVNYIRGLLTGKQFVNNRLRADTEGSPIPIKTKDIIPFLQMPGYEDNRKYCEED